ncbi:type II toxin-antitoxin system death-on-curing family toxin [Aquiluna sp.]|nr:type II toxin-antitoxin system death-on-curing family toxin [Aquiluna sp.]
MQYLSLEDALQQIAISGFYVKDAGLLDSALARPQTSVFGEDAYPTLELKAAAMTHSVINNHPMVDGNKRTSWFLLNAFLYINGYLLEMSTEEGLEFTLGVATDQLSLEGAAEKIRSHMRAIS